MKKNQIQSLHKGPVCPHCQNPVVNTKKENVIKCNHCKGLLMVSTFNCVNESGYKPFHYQGSDEPLKLGTGSIFPIYQVYKEGSDWNYVFKVKKYSEERVFHGGNAYAIKSYLSKGIVSAKNASVEQLHGQKNENNLVYFGLTREPALAHTQKNEDGAICFNTWFDGYVIDASKMRNKCGSFYNAIFDNFKEISGIEFCENGFGQSIVARENYVAPIILEENLEVITKKLRIIDDWGIKLKVNWLNLKKKIA